MIGEDGILIAIIAKLKHLKTETMPKGFIE